MTDGTVPDTTVPDTLFDADLSDPSDRSDWIVVDGEAVHAPATWTWRCSECGTSGVMPDSADLMALPRPHGDQHAEGVFGRVVPLELDVVRDGVD